ncbi:MAG TPA: DMT family transporter [Gemmatimonadales bacterium]|nr:DMT family transporter [Gemmatimonadales bacterium]
MTRRQGVLWLVVIAVIWGASFVLIKATLTLVSPLLLLAFRFLLAALFVVAWLRGLTRSELEGGLVLGLFFWGGFVFQTVGLEYTTPSRSAFITGLSTPLVPVAEFLLHRRRPSAGTVAAIGVTAVGIWLLTHPGGGGGLNRGDLLTFGCAALFALQIDAAGRYTRLGRPGRLVALELTAAGVLSLAAAPWVEHVRLVPGWPAAAALLALALIAATTFYGQLAAQAVVSPAVTAVIFTLEPLAAALTSWLLLGEVLTGLQWLGGALIIGAVALLR